MDDRDRIEDEEPDDDEELEGEPPPEVLDHLIDELIDFKEERDEDLEVEWIAEEGLYRVVGTDPLVDVLVVEIDGEFYGESEAVVVEAEIGPLRKDLDLAELLRFSDEELVYGRLALAADEEGTEILVLQAAAPIHQLTASQLDGMIREVAELSRELREEPPSEVA